MHTWLQGTHILCICQGTLQDLTHAIDQDAAEVQAWYCQLVCALAMAHTVQGFIGDTLGLIRYHPYH